MSNYVLNIQTKLNPGIDKIHIHEYLKKKKKKAMYPQNSKLFDVWLF